MNTIVLNPPPAVTVQAVEAPVLIHRQDIAHIANALLLALQNGPEAAGVLLLARALGCEVKKNGH